MEKAIKGVLEFFSMLGHRVAAWFTGDDITLFVVLGVVALLLLFAFIPNRRRY